MCPTQMITAASLSALDLTYQSVLLGPVASTTAERLFSGDLILTSKRFTIFLSAKPASFVVIQPTDEVDKPENKCVA